MRSHAETFKYKNKNYSMTMILDIPYASACIYNDKCNEIITLSKFYDGFNRPITYDFEVDFTILFDFIDENYEDILKYKKLYDVVLK